MKIIGKVTTMRHICFGLVLACLMMLAFGHKTYAASDRKALSLNNQYITGRIDEKGEADFYSITVPSDGWLTITYQGWDIYDSYYELWTEDMESRVYIHELSGSSTTNPLTNTDTHALESGNYTIKIYAWSSNVGDYRLKGSFEAAENTETDGNDAWSSAMNLSCDKPVRGFFSWQDRSDFYKFSVNTNCTVQVLLTNRTGDMYISLWNSDYINVKQIEIYGSEDSPQTGVIEMNLDPGVYFLKCEPYGSHTGRYDLKWRLAPTKVTAITITGNRAIHVGDSVQLNATVMPSNANNKTLTWRSENTNVATVDANTGKVKGKGVGTARIVASATDDSEQSAEVIVCVSAKKMNAPKASAKGKKKVQLKWKQQNGVQKYQVQLSKKKNFKNAKTWTFGSYQTSAIKKVKSKGTWYFRVRGVVTLEGKTYYGEWSKAKKIKVK
ncbi:MAG: Ig-like domain-containing protein [Lachnospiraceae bacterium]|nr:Ig-like domain-containing protein [Lachnospiraceae bacterium]